MIQVPRGLFVSWGRCHEVPQTGWLKTAGVHSLTVLESGGPTSTTGLAGLCSSGGSGGESAPRFSLSSCWSQQFLAIFGLHVRMSFQSLPLSSCGLLL